MKCICLKLKTIKTTTMLKQVHYQIVTVAIKAYILNDEMLCFHERFNSTCPQKNE